MAFDNKHRKPGSDPRAFMEAAIDLAAEQLADETETTAADLRFAGEQQLKLRPVIAELRRRLVPAEPLVKRPTPISSELLALSREALLARLEGLRQRGHVQYAFQDLTGLTDDDLRQTLSLLLERTKG